MSATLPIALLSGRGSLRQPLVYVALVAFPASYFLVMTLLAGTQLGRHALIGAIVGFAVNAGVVSLPQIVLLYRYRGLHDMIVASPVPRGSYVIGLAASRLIYVAPPLAATLALLAIVTGDTVSPWRLLAVLPLAALCWLVGSLLGFTVVRGLASPSSVSALSNMLGLLLVLLPPVYYPLDLLPGWLHWPALAVPTANCAELMRIVLGQSSAGASELALQVAVLASICGLAAWVTLGDRHWRTR
jgi:ABC-2 type transport system permease protein